MTNLGLVLALGLIALCFLVIIFVIPNAAATIEFSKERAEKETNDTTNNRPGSDKPEEQEDLQPEEQSRDLDSSSPSTDSNIMDAESLFPSEENYCNADLVDENTFQGYTIKTGTNNADQLFGTSNKDLILGLDGDDMIYGSGDDDIICGGKGHDYLFGESHPNVIIRQPGNPGKDLIFGQEGNDTINGGPGNDILQGGSGNNFFVGDQGNDYILGGGGADYGFGGGGNDVIYGSNGISVLRGNDGNDKLYGGNGKDYFEGGEGDDLMDGGPGQDTCYDTDQKTFLNCEIAGHPPPS
jgi:Ca2+-binding RTX toxin-like protein